MPDCKFVVLYQPVRPDLGTTITPEEMATVGRHFEYLKRQMEAGRLYLAGRTQDATLGVALLTVETQEEAQAFADEDPAVTEALFRPEVKAWMMALAPPVV